MAKGEGQKLVTMAQVPSSLRSSDGCPIWRCLKITLLDADVEKRREVGLGLACLGHSHPPVRH